MTTATELLRASLDGIGEQLEQLLEQSSIRHMDFRGTGIAYFGATGVWQSLEIDAQRDQAQVLEDYRHVAPIIRALLRAQPPDAMRVFEEAHEELLKLIEQDSSTGFQTTEDAKAKAHKALDSLSNLLDRLPDRSDGQPV